MVPWKNEILETAEGPGSAKNNSQSPLVLAANRTKRPDILHGFRVYEGGWDIANQNYWAVSSVNIILFHHLCLVYFSLNSPIQYNFL